MAADASNREAEQPDLLNRRPAGRRFDDLLQDLPRPRTLNGDVVNFRRRGLQIHIVIGFGRLLLEPDEARIVATDPAEIVIAQSEQRSVVDHAAVLVAHRRIDDLADR